MGVMRCSFLFPCLLVLSFLPGPVWAVEAAPALTDREIVERLTRLEEGQSAIRAEMGQLRADMHRQNQHLRDHINAQFDRLFQLLLGCSACLAPW